MSANHTRASPERFNKDAAIAATQSAALRGAALAFGKPPVKPKPQTNTYSGNNGALAAATKVGGSRSLDNKASISSLKADGPQDGYRSERHDRPGSRKSGSYTELQRQIVPTGNGLLRPNPEQRRSTSFLAANLAASRSPSVSPNVTGQRQLQKHSTGGGWEATTISRRSASPLKSGISSRGSDRPLDLTSIPPTTSLINMFEQNKEASQTSPALSAAQKSVGSSAQRAPSVSAPLPTASSRPPKQQATTRISPTQHARPRRPTIVHQSFVKSYAPPHTHRPISVGSRPQTAPDPKNVRNDKREAEDGSSDDSFVSASDRRPSSRAPVYQQRHSDRPGSQYSNSAVDSLANAIVASSLASSRAASPSRNLQGLGAPPPPSRRDPRSHHLLHHHDTSRSGSPAKPIGLRTTMRKPKSEEEPEEVKRRMRMRTHLIKHPNKHNEGGRKRWRDIITERERKRYEAVWASNRGLHLPADLESSVCNLVVRDIWSRSNLKDDVLEEVYMLVDREGRGSLAKEEFVVGLWLVDQRLKGRKLPIRVSDSVWHSVGVLREIKMKHDKKHDKKSAKRK